MPMPAFIRAWLTQMKLNRRRYDRRNVACAVRLLVQDAGHDCLIRDVSPSGALLSGAPVLPPGTPVILEIPAVALCAEARVVRNLPAGIAIEFSRDGVGAIIAGWTQGQTPLAG
ncbi:PilZ domain-containing protein [Niveispirillum irakense]|uniref:PilZ domain-containing protein n=1 Tax=Niveispirillum irakense TaxID=34011 RepID=UPI00041B08FD|nr:PilZ domain-containing protein [Niveispirillum irakense]